MKKIILLVAFMLVCSNCYASPPIYKAGEAVLFWYYRHDSKKDIKEKGVIISLVIVVGEYPSYAIVPKYEINSGNYVIIREDKIIKKLNG